MELPGSLLFATRLFFSPSENLSEPSTLESRVSAQRCNLHLCRLLCQAGGRRNPKIDKSMAKSVNLW
jgi:hypothetical protein